MKKRIFSVVGTRPEVIKMAPVIHAIAASSSLENIVCASSQHREMQDDMLDLFEIKPDFDLNVMVSNQSLDYLTSIILEKMTAVLKETEPDLVLVQGDTTTSFVASLAAFYQGIPVGHVEAGLRTYHLKQPFPEEANRQLTSRLAHYHFAPTAQAQKNLLAEGVPETQVFVTGNTVIDALFWMKANLNENRVHASLPPFILALIAGRSPYVLITGHRRENFGEGFSEICLAIKTLAQQRSHWQFIYPVHLNPNVQKPVFEILQNLPNVHLIEPVGYELFVYLMMHCQLILTDSGGVQEEAPSLGKPVLVMRHTTERPEGLEANTAKLVGSQQDTIIAHVLHLMDDPHEYAKMAQAVNPYGDGLSAQKILRILEGL